MLQGALCKRRAVKSPPQVAAGRKLSLVAVRWQCGGSAVAVVRDGWQRGQTLAVLGWIYGLQDGLPRDLDTTVTHPGEVAACYGNALARLS
jgi:carbonic anhydrase